MSANSIVFEPMVEAGPLLIPRNEIDPDNYPVGGVMVRFQASDITPGQKALVDYMTKRHGYQVVLLGVPLISGKPKNPLDYAAREQMVRKMYPDVVVLPVDDVPGDDVAWSANIDKAIRTAFPRVEGKALLYGSRDSFIPYYVGRNHTQQLETNRADISATDSRKYDSRTMQNNPSWRAGFINAIENARPVSWGTADIAGFSPEGLMLIGKKHKDGDKWRFVGGFKEVINESYEEVAMREFWEETGEVATINDPKYILSTNVKDPRYEGTGDVVTTIVFWDLIAGVERLNQGSDDLKGEGGLAWLNLNNLIDGSTKVEDLFISEHIHVVNLMLTKISAKRSDLSDLIATANVQFKTGFPIISITERKQVIRTTGDKTEAIHNYLHSEEKPEETNISAEK